MERPVAKVLESIFAIFNLSLGNIDVSDPETEDVRQEMSDRMCETGDMI